ncbi:helix-turn-helix transcriptional regulator [Parabacteroides sp. AF17-28]|uniref:helix-turn-helix transcriptional regulator n=1 Tax=Parabacteroides sp. AF17-28 TaxID=2292241 RepID=UPI000EFFE239|nr:helix-turn-helix transcriptional regulator [Parabacteroides sp. AF17-28]RHR62837.1 XRE family transcriptional regulator [Parabacteroides sp. AF17-28]
MEKKFENIVRIDTPELFEKVSDYVEELINEATKKGALSVQGERNEYTLEISRAAGMCADYEALYYKPKSLRFKSPLITSIEEELEKRSLKQRQAAEFLEVKESTFSQIMTGKRPVSMRMAKRLYEKLNIDPALILKFA